MCCETSCEMVCWNADKLRLSAPIYKSSRTCKNKWGLAWFALCKPLLTGMTTVSCLGNLEAICVIIRSNFLPNSDVPLTSQQFSPEMLRASGPPIPAAGPCPGHRSGSLVPLHVIRLQCEAWGVRFSVIVSVSAQDRSIQEQTSPGSTPALKSSSITHGAILANYPPSLNPQNSTREGWRIGCNIIYEVLSTVFSTCNYCHYKKMTYYRSGMETRQVTGPEEGCMWEGHIHRYSVYIFFYN